MNVLHSFIPAPTFLTFGSFSISWYGVLIIVATLAGLAMALWAAKKKQTSSDHVYNLFLLLPALGIVAGRVVHVLFEWPYYRDDPIRILYVWQGGLSLFGVFLGSLFGLTVYVRVRKLSFWVLGDIMALGAPLAQAIGRWGNYFNQELFGLPTNGAWGIPIDIAHRPSTYELQSFFHPLFLYESVLDLALFFLLLVFFKKNVNLQGRVFLWYFAGYAVIRFTLDFLRINPESLGPLSVAQWACIAIVLAAVVLWRRRRSVDG